MARSVPPARAVQHITSAIAGGYAFTWGFMALSLASLFAAGMSYNDAQFLSALLGMLVFAGAFLWAFIARSLVRIWAVLLLGAAAMTAAASLLQRTLVQ